MPDDSIGAHDRAALAESTFGVALISVSAGDRHARRLTGDRLACGDHTRSDGRLRMFPRDRATSRREPIVRCA